MWSGIPSIDDYKIKILINSVKHWRYVLGYWIFSQDLILHAEGKENFHVISMQTCFCLKKWTKLQAERELFWNKFSANYSALHLCCYSDDVRPQAQGSQSVLFLCPYFISLSPWWRKTVSGTRGRKQKTVRSPGWNCLFESDLFLWTPVHTWAFHDNEFQFAFFLLLLLLYL